MKKVKVFLPITAAIIAVLGAFGSAISATKNALVPIPVVLSTSTCIQQGRCSDTGTSPCKNQDQAQLFEREDEETCNVPAVGTYMNP